MVKKECHAKPRRQRISLLTAQERRLLERREHLGRDVDHEVLLMLHEVIARLDPLTDKVLKRRMTDRVQDVHDKLPRDTADLLGVWEVIHDIRLSSGKVEHDLDSQVLVVGHSRVSNLVAT